MVHLLAIEASPFNQVYPVLITKHFLSYREGVGDQMMEIGNLYESHKKTHYLEVPQKKAQGRNGQRSDSEEKRKTPGR